MPAKKKETYSEAMARLEKIVSQIDSNQLDIDQLARSRSGKITVRRRGN